MGLPFLKPLSHQTPAGGSVRFPPISAAGGARAGRGSSEESISTRPQQPAAENHEAQVPPCCLAQACCPQVVQYWIHMQQDGKTPPILPSTGHAHHPSASRKMQAMPGVTIQQVPLAERTHNGHSGQLCAERMARSKISEGEAATSPERLGLTSQGGSGLPCAPQP